MIFSVNHFVLLKIGADGTIEHTEPLQLLGFTDQREASENLSFFALAQFFDSVARGSIARYGQPKAPNFPCEILDNIVNAVDDMPTYRNLMRTSPMFRHICLENFRLHPLTVFLPNTATKGLSGPEAGLQYTILDRNTDLKYDVKCECEEPLDHYLKVPDRKDKYKSFQRIVVGKERSKRLMLPQIVSLLPQTAKEQEGSEASDKGDGDSEIRNNGGA